MAPKGNTLERMRQNPQADWKIKDVQTLCDQHNIEVIPPKRGDHYKVKSPFLRDAQIIPAARPIKAPYIRSLVGMVDAHIFAAAEQKGGK